MVLSIDSLSQCCGAGNKCIGFLAAYRLEMKAKNALEIIDALSKAKTTRLTDQSLLYFPDEAALT
jgi:hypothetical protein